MSKLSLKTKIEAVFLACVLTGIFSSVVTSTYLSYTGPNGSYAWTSTDQSFIECSPSGTRYNATAANIQIAINSMNGTKNASVSVPGLSYSVTGKISIWSNINVNFNYATLRPTGDFIVLQPWWETTVENVIINASGVSNANTTGLIAPYGYKGSGLEGFDLPHPRTMRDVTVIGSIPASPRCDGIGLLLNPTVYSDDFAWDRYENFNFKYLNTAVKLLVDVYGTYVNFNTFDKMTIVACHYGIVGYVGPNCGTNEISQNYFLNCKYETETGVITADYPIYLYNNTHQNKFQMQIMDWPAATAIKIEAGLYTPDYNYFEIGGIPNTGVYISDAGVSNQFWMAYTYGGIKTPSLNTTYVNRYNPSATGVKFYSSSTSNPYTYFYGWNGAAAKWGAFYVTAAQNFRIESEEGDIELRPDQGAGTSAVVVNSILRLQPRAALPTSPTDGMICYISGNDTAFCWNGAWKSLW